MTDSPLAKLIRPCRPLHVDMTLAEAARQISEHGSGLPVVGDGTALLGFLDEVDLLAATTPGYLKELHGTDLFLQDPASLQRAIARAAPTRVGAHMRTAAVHVDTNDSEMHATALFLQSGQHTLPVVDVSTRQVVGVLRLLDLLRELVQSNSAP